MDRMDAYFEEVPMTLAVALLGNDGVVIASDTCVERINLAHQTRTTDTSPKIRIIGDKLAYTFAGDDCAKAVGTAVAEASANCVLSESLIEKVSNKTLRAYREQFGVDRVDYRKNIWAQKTNGEYTIWHAVCSGRAEWYAVLSSSKWRHEGKFRVFAGDEFNQARYIIEHYYDNYPLRNISGLTNLAAHLILTGSRFRSSNVRGLEVVVGNSKGFTSLPTSEIEALVALSRRIHQQNDGYFGG